MLLHEAAVSGTFDPAADWPAFRTWLGSTLAEISRSRFTPEPTAKQAEFLDSLVATLNTSFAHAPPFTFQRLAELVEQPDKHYPVSARDKYLTALERVVSVEGSLPEFEAGFRAGRDDGDLWPSSTAAAAAAAAAAATATGTIGALSLANGNSGVVMSPIAWLVDTGTPPPDSPPQYDRNGNHGEAGREMQDEPDVDDINGSAVDVIMDVQNGTAAEDKQDVADDRPE